MQPNANTLAKQAKKQQFHHARDNAIASLGKVLKYQMNYLASRAPMDQQLLNGWLKLLPISHDMEEAQGQHQFLSEIIVSAPAIFEKMCGANIDGSIEHLATIYGDCFDAKHWDYDGVKEESVPEFKLAMSNAVKCLMNGPRAEVFKTACANKLKAESQQNVQDAYTYTA
jgi:hypothetical protein